MDTYYCVVRFIDGKYVDCQFQTTKLTEKSLVELKYKMMEEYPRYSKHEMVIINIIKLEDSK